MRFASVLWKVIVFAYWRHKASFSRSALSCGSFICKHKGMYKLFHLSNTRVIHFLHLHQCCYISRLSPWAKFPFRTPHDVSAQSDGRTVCSSTGAKRGSPVLSASVAPDHLLVWMFLPCLIPAVIQYDTVASHGVIQYKQRRCQTLIIRATLKARTLELVIY